MLRLFEASKEELAERLDDIDTLRLNEGQKAVIVARLATAQRGRGRAGEARITRKELAEKLGVAPITAHWASVFLKHADPVQHGALIDKVQAGVLTLTEACKLLGLRKNISKRTKQKLQNSPLRSTQPVNPPPRYITREFLERDTEAIIFTPFPAELLMRRMEDGIIDCIITDPPYNAGIQAWDVGFEPQKYIDEFARVLKPGGSALIFCHSVLLPTYLSSPTIGNPPTDEEVKVAKKLLREANQKNDASEITRYSKLLDKILKRLHVESSKPLILKQVLHWHKPNSQNKHKNKTTRRKYHSAIEYIIWLVKPGEKHTYNIPLAFEDIIDKRMTDLVIVPTVGGYEKLEANLYSIGESPKPFRLIELLVKAHTNMFDVILDPFHGKGITGLVSYLSGRQFIGSELDKRKIGVQVSRINQLMTYMSVNTINKSQLNRPLIKAKLNGNNKIEKSIIEKYFLQLVTDNNHHDLRMSDVDGVWAHHFFEYFVYRSYVNDVTRKIYQLNALMGRDGIKKKLVEAIEEFWENGEMLPHDINMREDVPGFESVSDVLHSTESERSLSYNPEDPPLDNPIRKIFEEYYHGVPQEQLFAYHYWAFPSLYDTNNVEDVDCSLPEIEPFRLPEKTRTKSRLHPVAFAGEPALDDEDV